MITDEPLPFTMYIIINVNSLKRKKHYSKQQRVRSVKIRKNKIKTQYTNLSKHLLVF